MASPRPLKSEHIGGQATVCFQKEPGALKFDPQTSLLMGTSATTLGMGCERHRDRDKGGRPRGPWLNQLRGEKGTQERGRTGRTERGTMRGRRCLGEAELQGSHTWQIPDASPAANVLLRSPPVTLPDPWLPLAWRVIAPASLHPTGLSQAGPRPAVHSADHLASWVLILGQCPFHQVTPAGLRALPPSPDDARSHGGSPHKRSASQLWAAAFRPAG